MRHDERGLRLFSVDLSSQRRRRSSCEAKPADRRLSKWTTRETMRECSRLILPKNRLRWRIHFTTRRCFLGDDGDVSDDLRIKLHSTPILLSGRPATLPFSFTISGSCPQLISNTTRLAKAAAGLSTQLPAKRSLFLHRILQLSAPVPTGTTTTTYFLPQRRKSEVPNSPPRPTTESLLLLK